MRVLLVHNFYQIPGGEDRVVREELSLLADRGVDVDLFSVTNDDLEGMMDRFSALLGLIYSPRARHALSKKLKEFRPDIVHIHNFFPLLSPSILDACGGAGVPSVMTLHNFRIFTPAALLHPDRAIRGGSLRSSCWRTVPMKVYRNSMAATLALAAMIEFHKWAGTWRRKVGCFIVLTEWARQMFIEGGLPAERIVVKPNCIARPTLSDDLRREGALFVGRLDDQKGVPILLRAWQQVNYPLRIVGDGPLADFVRRQTNDRIVYLGRQPREVVQKEMQSAKFLVLPSIGQELLPITILEAFSNRLPVLCSNIASLGGLVEPGLTGLKFPSGDADALAALARWAVANPVALEEMGRGALAAYEERYTPDANFNHLMNIYRAVKIRAPRVRKSDLNKTLAA